MPLGYSFTGHCNLCSLGDSRRFFVAIPFEPIDGRRIFEYKRQVKKKQFRSLAELYLLSAPLAPA